MHPRDLANYRTFIEAYPRNVDEWRPVGDDAIEAPCMVCGEVLLLMAGDDVQFVCSPEQEVQGFLCTACGKQIPAPFGTGPAADQP